MALAWFGSPLLNFRGLEGFAAFDRRPQVSGKLIVPSSCSGCIVSWANVGKVPLQRVERFFKGNPGDRRDD
jgi:hypothetical protein